jgi:hypothetical protein
LLMGVSSSGCGRSCRITAMWLAVEAYP